MCTLLSRLLPLAGEKKFKPLSQIGILVLLRDSFQNIVHLYGSTLPGALHWRLVVFFNNQEEEKTILEDFITLKADML